MKIYRLVLGFAIPIPTVFAAIFAVYCIKAFEAGWYPETLVAGVGTYIALATAVILGLIWARGIN